jgi:SAM-dependent MidA family methyltransferase
MASPASISDEFRKVFATAAGASGVLSFDRYMDLALYHPAVGYYRKERPRVGLNDQSDFFTASSLGEIFGELITAACVELVGADRVQQLSFVEIGAESSSGILGGLPSPFKETRTCRIGEPLELEGPCVVFSNELFDAQPFRRFVRRENMWRELGVALLDERLSEVEIDGAIPTVLPQESLNGYVIDLPMASVALMEKIARQPWSGLLIACDYGKSWRELTEACPFGTARAYYRHQQSNDLLARPGEQDLTCHVCWDWLTTCLEQNGFGAPVVETHEAFFIRHATSLIAQTSAAEAHRFSRRKNALMQLLHPAHLGQKFQVLHARRE